MSIMGSATYRYIQRAMEFVRRLIRSSWKSVFRSVETMCRNQDTRLLSLFSEESVVVRSLWKAKTRAMPHASGGIRVRPSAHACDGCFSCSLWRSRTVEEPRSPLTTGAAARAASTRRPPPCRSAAVAAAAIHLVSLPFVPPSPRMVALARQKIYSMIVIKVRRRSST